MFSLVASFLFFPFYCFFFCFYLFFSSGRWGHALLLGGGLAWGITIFHFVVESILAKRMGFDSSADPQAMAKFHVVIQKVPRVAMVVLSAIFLLMMIAARGI